MSLKRRVNKLEDEVGPLRCDQCRAWPEIRLKEQIEDGPVIARDDTPERCPGCGWEPLTIIVHYTTDAASL